MQQPSPTTFEQLVGAVDVMVFDLGGVLLDTAGLPPVIPELVAPRSGDFAGLGHDVATFVGRDRVWSRAELWARWLGCSATDDFESGQIDAEEFARRIVDELELGVAPGAVRARMDSWLAGPLPTALDLLAELRQGHPGVRLVCFSNSNPIHWPQKQRWFGEYLDAMFSSHLLGVAKPHDAAFEAVRAGLGTEPSRIGFIDDNQVNVDAATRAGWRAFLHVGVPQLDTSLC
ncbi:MAG: HAD-IA family hydrolase [Actinobacteria bacterium]|nr:HAD-IA family hydrolase [Actinomycetota bacterium]MCB9388354.1 HAD-IA family hydrolase [Acidimicrobiia bacterium]